MARKTLAPKATQKRTSDPDPAEIGLRLRGLGRLIEHAANGGPDAVPIDATAAYFIERALNDMAEELARA